MVMETDTNWQHLHKRILALEERMNLSGVGVSEPEPTAITSKEVKDKLTEEVALRNVRSEMITTSRKIMELYYAAPQHNVSATGSEEDLIFRFNQMATPLHEINVCMCVIEQSLQTLKEASDEPK